MGRRNKCRKKVTLYTKKHKGNILNLRRGKVLRRTLAETNFAETSGTSTKQNEITIQTDKNVSKSVPAANCEIEDLIKELEEAISEKDSSFSSTVNFTCQITNSDFTL